MPPVDVRTFRASGVPGGKNDEFDLGVLFVPGMGVQGRGQTMAKFTQPVYGWLQDRFRGLDRRWRLSAGEAESAAVNAWRSKVEEWATDGFKCDPPAHEGLSPTLIKQLAEALGCDTVVGRVAITDARPINPIDHHVR